jgi:hypothetical protein
MYTLLARSAFERYLNQVFAFMDEPVSRWTMEELMPFIGFVALIAGCFSLLILFIRMLNQGAIDNDNEQKPVIETQAKIILVERLSDKYNVSFTYYCTFECEDGTRHRLNIPKASWNNYVEGDRGTVVFQGTKFKSFTLNRSTEQS